MNPRLKRALWLLARIAVSVLLLGVLFREPELASQLWARLQDMGGHLPWVFAGLGFMAVTILLTALRWWLVLRPHVPEAGLPFVLRTTVEAWFFNVTTFGSLGGDAWRVIEVRRRFPGHGISGGMSVVADHAAGLAGTLVFSATTGALVLLQVDHAGPGVRDMVWQLALILLIVSVGMTLSLLTLSPPFLRRFGQHTPGRLKPFVYSASRRMGVMVVEWRSVAAAVLVSLALMSCHFMTFYCGLRAVGGRSEMLPLFLAMPLVDLAASLPISVAGLGVREKTFESLMHAMTGMPVDISVSASLAGWLLTVAGGLVGGLMFASGRRPQTEGAP